LELGVVVELQEEDDTDTHAPGQTKRLSLKPFSSKRVEPFESVWGRARKLTGS